MNKLAQQLVAVLLACKKWQGCTHLRACGVRAACQHGCKRNLESFRTDELTIHVKFALLG